MSRTKDEKRGAVHLGKRVQVTTCALVSGMSTGRYFGMQLVSLAARSRD